MGGSVVGAIGGSLGLGQAGQGTDFAGMIEDRVGIDMGGKSSGDKALDEQRRAANEANDLHRSIYEQQRGDTAKYREMGNKAVDSMQDPSFQRDFTMADYEQDPGYQFRLDEGRKALEASAAARGSMGSGRTLKELTRYTQGVASDEYNNAYNRFNANADRRFNRLASMAGTGQTAIGQVGQGGMNMGNQIGGNMVGIGNAAATNEISRANRMNKWMDKNEDMMMSAGGMMFSDARLKFDVQPVSKEDLAELRKVVKPFLYKFKNQNHGRGEWIGPMAQDLEKSKLGRRIVETDSQGRKVINQQKAIALALACLAEE